MAFTDEVKIWHIYKITNPNGSVYIGKTTRLRARINHYRANNSLNQKLIANSISKYGWDKHLFEVIDTFSGTSSGSDSKEIFWIRSNMSYRKQFPDQKGLNLTIGGSGSIGNKWTPEQKAHMSKIKKGKEYRHTEEAKKKIGDASRGNRYRYGTKQTEEWKQNASKRLKGHKYNVGVRYSKESIEKRMIKLRGRKDSELIKEKKRIAQAISKGKAICQFDLDGNLLAEFISINEAARQLNWHQSLISKVLGGARNCTNNWVFKYK